MWFKNLTGFNEQSPHQVRANLEVSGNTMTSRVNGKSWNCGLLDRSKAMVALANKMTRICWVIITTGEAFDMKQAFKPVA